MPKYRINKTTHQPQWGNKGGTNVIITTTYTYVREPLSHGCNTRKLRMREPNEGGARDGGFAVRGMGRGGCRVPHTHQSRVGGDGEGPDGQGAEHVKGHAIYELIKFQTVVPCVRMCICVWVRGWGTGGGVG